MEIGKEEVPLPEQFALLGLGFLDFDDHLAFREDLFCVLDDLRARRRVVLIHKPGAKARSGLNCHRMAMRDGVAYRVWCHADPVFVRFDLFRASNMHLNPPFAERLDRFHCNRIETLRQIAPWLGRNT